MLCVILQASVTSVRYQVIRLMRMLVQLCNTLDQVPEEVRPHSTPFLALAWKPRSSGHFPLTPAHCSATCS